MRYALECKFVRWSVENQPVEVGFQYLLRVQEMKPNCLYRAARVTQKHVVL